MTELLAQIDAYTREFTATVTEVVDGGVVLDRSAFLRWRRRPALRHGRPARRPPDLRRQKGGRVEGKIVHQIDGPAA